MKPEGLLDCNQCGKCCLKAGSLLGTASKSDLQRWKNRPDIMRYVAHVYGGVYDLFINPRTQEDDLRRCPFLRKYPKRDAYYCRIYDLRPDVCRRYPMSIESASEWECEMVPSFRREK